MNINIIPVHYDGFFNPEKVGQERAELQNLKYLENGKSFKDFLRAYFWLNKKGSEKYTRHYL